MNKTRSAGGICLVAVLQFLAVTACAPVAYGSTVVSAPPTASEAQPVLLTQEPVMASTADLVEFSADSVPASPAPTSPPKPTTNNEAVATARSAITLGDLRIIEDAGFSFRPVVGYDLHLKPDQATLVNRDGTIILSMTGVPVQSGGSLEEHLDQLLSGVGGGMEEFNAGSPYAVNIGKKDGLAADITGRLSGEKVAGQILMVAASDSQLFYAIALIVEQPGGEENLAEGDKAIEAVIESITFIDPHTQ
jgi:hypothetical protein